MVEPSGQLIVARDGFGNVIHLSAVTKAHSEIVVRTGGSVEVENRGGVVTGLFEPVPPRVYLRQTRLTEPDNAIRRVAAEGAGLETIPRLHAMMTSIRDRVDYRIGESHAETTAAEAIAKGVGVCQDHAHVFIAAARCAGIPARYVTGYIVVDGSGPAEAHHAWAEAWVEGLGWVGFDVANRICPTDDHVRLAAALDAYYAAPIRGSRRGGEAEQLEVAVDVRGSSVQQSQSQQ